MIFYPRPSNQAQRNSVTLLLLVVQLLSFLPICISFFLHDRSALYLGLVLLIFTAVIIIYFGYVAPSILRYEMTEKGLKIKKLLGWRLIPWKMIKSVKATDVESMFRLIGVSLPTYLYGLFNAPGRGNIVVYATTYDPTSNSEVVMIELEQGFPVVITPKDSQRFIEKLKLFR